MGQFEPGVVVGVLASQLIDCVTTLGAPHGLDAATLIERQLLAVLDYDDNEPPNAR